MRRLVPLGLLLASLTLLGQEASWKEFVTKIEREKRIEVTFHQVFLERESGMEVEDQGMLLAVHGEGMAIRYSDGRLYILKRDGVWLSQEGSEAEWHPWDKNLKENPLLWLVGLSSFEPDPSSESDRKIEFGPRPELWTRVVISWDRSTATFPSWLEITDEEGNINRFTFNLLLIHVETNIGI